MKKLTAITAIILVLSLTVTGAFAFTEHLLDVEGAKWCNYPIYLNNEIKVRTGNNILLNDTIYVPLREFCNNLNVNVDWHDRERSIHLSTSLEDEITNNYEISEETALKLAEVYYEEIFGKPFTERTYIRKIQENDGVYKILRFPKDSGTIGGGGTIYISKKNGQLLKTELGE